MKNERELIKLVLQQHMWLLVLGKSKSECGDSLIFYSLLLKGHRDVAFLLFLSQKKFWSKTISLFFRELFTVHFLACLILSKFNLPSFAGKLVLNREINGSARPASMAILLRYYSLP